jgi:hypothetical protein
LAWLLWTMGTFTLAEAYCPTLKVPLRVIEIWPVGTTYDDGIGSTVTLANP